MKKLGTICVLGTNYDVILKNYQDEEEFKTKDDPSCGLCSFMRKEIIVGNIATFPGYERYTTEDAASFIQVSLRHEIIHAFLYESGLDTSSMSPEDSWARNEEMIDWFAIQLPKMITEFKKVAALE